MAGTGKSTLALTISHQFAEETPLNASFFFSKGGGDLGHAGKFVTTLASQLAENSRAFRNNLCDVIKENPKIAERTLSEQWKLLISQPLSKLQTVQLIAVVIDALDECDNIEDIKVIVQLLAKTAELETVRFRAFITSRPDVHTKLVGIPVKKYLHLIPKATVEEDITLFISKELKKIANLHRFPAELEWPTKDEIDRLSKKAECLFIFASTACKFIGDTKYNPDKRLSIILQGTSSAGRSATKEIDMMYTRVLQESLLDGDYEDGEVDEDFKHIVGAIIVLLDTLPTMELARLLSKLLSNEPQRCQHAIVSKLGCLNSVIDTGDENNRDGNIRLLHPSFRDFLLDNKRCVDTRFQIDEKKVHNDLLMGSLDLMAKHLKMDMCNLCLLGVNIKEVNDDVVRNCIPLGVQYACHY